MIRSSHPYVIVPVLSGFAVVGGVVPWSEPIEIGRAWVITDATHRQLGALIEPEHREGTGTAIAVPGVLLWHAGTLDADANGFVNGEDLDLYTRRFAAGSAAADFDENGFVNGEDVDAFRLWFALGTVLRTVPIHASVHIF